LVLAFASGGNPQGLSLFFFMELSFADTLIEVWRQSLIETADTVKLGTRRYKVTIVKTKHLRQVQFEFDGKSILGVEQNPETSTRWAEMARSGKKVMQFIVEGRYAANVADGKLTIYGKRTSD
jgi:hypothetical protein